MKKKAQKAAKCEVITAAGRESHEGAHVGQIIGRRQSVTHARAEGTKPGRGERRRQRNEPEIAGERWPCSRRRRPRAAGALLLDALDRDAVARGGASSSQRRRRRGALAAETGGMVPVGYAGRGGGQRGRRWRDEWSLDGRADGRPGKDLGRPSAGPLKYIFFSI